MHVSTLYLLRFVCGVCAKLVMCRSHCPPFAPAAAFAPCLTRQQPCHALGIPAAPVLLMPSPHPLDFWSRRSPTTPATVGQAVSCVHTTDTVGTTMPHTYGTAIKPSTNEHCQSSKVLQDYTKPNQLRITAQLMFGTRFGSRRAVTTAAAHCWCQPWA